MNNEPMNEASGYTVGTPHPTATAQTTAPHLAQQISEALAMAAALDDAARAHRKTAGRLLAQVRGEQPTGAHWYAAAGLDMRSAELLIELGVGAKPAGHPI